jgi:hypothetical protein
MARGGFFRRIGNAIRNVVAPRPPTREPEPPPQPPREQGPRGGSGGNPWRRVWRDQDGKGNYQKNLAVFHALIDPVEPDETGQLELWESYIRHINKGEGRFRRQSTSNMFWRDSGIDPADMDWRRWRVAMGYTGKNRSRTA